MGFLVSHVDWASDTRISVAVSFLGFYTTFSTLTVATVQSFENGYIPSAAINLLTSVSVGFAAVAAGLVMGRAI